MLVLSRKAGERVRIDVSGTHIWVTVCEIDRGKIRLGFDASRCVTIEREEVVGMRRNGVPPEPIKTVWGKV